jgi:hypothetical protein
MGVPMASVNGVCVKELMKEKERKTIKECNEIMVTILRNREKNLLGDALRQQRKVEGGQLDEQN